MIYSRIQNYIQKISLNNAKDNVKRNCIEFGNIILIKFECEKLNFSRGINLNRKYSTSGRS
jgi:hypothetical protein